MQRSGSSDELREFNGANSILLTLSDEAVEAHIPCAPSEGRPTRTTTPNVKVVRELRESVGMARGFQLSADSKTPSDIIVNLPLNATQLNQLLSHEAVASVSVGRRVNEMTLP